MIFKTTKALINEINEFLDIISEGALVFNSGIQDYVKNNTEEFHQRLEAIDKFESRADKLQKNIENSLYRLSLVPELRGDLLALLDAADEVIDTSKETLVQLDIETPEIEESLAEKYIELGEVVSACSQSLVKSMRLFFREPKAVKDHLHEVYYFEKESDRIGIKLKEMIFKELKSDLSKKMHLRYFVTHIDMVADRAKTVADQLSILAIKQPI